MNVMDFSNWAETLFDYSLELITNKQILQYSLFCNKVSLSKDYLEKQKELLNTPLESHLYWIGFGVGVECLAKAVLIKNEVMNIKKMNLPDYHKYQSEDINKVYKHISSCNIDSKESSWLVQQFKSKDIEHPRELITPTLGKIYKKEIIKLKNKGTITNDEYNLLFRSLELFTIMRRNVDAHIFLKERVLGSINKDIENVYIPMINLLIAVYNR